MILIDTSIWISLFRNSNSEIGQKMWFLTAENKAALCGQVWVEYIGGFRKHEERKKHQAALKIFPFLETPQIAYQNAADLLASHPRLSAGDAIIAATALHYKVPLFTLDKDFSELSSEGLSLF
ncbi:MAG: PIN domain-containing protein [Deltaproteobacteria bacterium]|nr:MAG: PIN domain-containing protein [Deltaproteobacteria bacterium]